jgi:NADH-quinone oxidoreductase subunit C
MPDTPDRAATAELVMRITDAVGADFLDAVSEQDMDEVALRPDGLLAAVELLRAAGFNMLLDIGGTDHHPLTPRFEISYHFLKFDLTDVAVALARPSLARPDRFRLRVFPSDADPLVPTLTHLWPSADWAEREVFDLFGVRFAGHPDLRRILMPDDWDGYPLRKDYPLRGFGRRFVPGGRVGPVPPLQP